MSTSPRGEVLRHQQHLVQQLTGETPALLLTTDAGLEDLVAAEAADRLGSAIKGGLYERRPRGFHGRVLILPPRLDPQMRNLALQMRSIHHIIEPRYTFQLTGDEPLEQIRCTLRERGMEGELATDGAFRVTSHRHGEHSFTSTDVQRFAGAGLIDRYGMGVDLVDFDHEIRVDVHNDECLVGIQWTRERLSKRSWRRYHPRASLRANVAYALLRFAKADEGRLIDPFCGSGTIPIEAAQYSDTLEICASDYSEEAITGARDNIAAAGIAPRIELGHHDVRRLLDVHAEGSFDLLVTNPPYGIRVGQGMNFFIFYLRFLHTAAHLLRPGGRLVFLAWKRGIVDKANQQQGYFKRLHARVIETGGIYPRMYVMERR